MLGRLIHVLSHLTLHGNRDQVVPVQAVDTDVVVVEQLPQLGCDRQPDFVDAGEPVEPRSELLNGLELGSPRRHLRVVLGGLDRHARLGCERRQRVELVVGPLTRPVVVDVEQAQQLGAVEERRRADRVEALLHDGGADTRAARVIPIVPREHRSPSLHGHGGQGRLREIANGGQVPAGQATGDRRHELAISLAEHDRGAVAPEQHHRVVDQAGQDLFEVQLAAYVLGHSTQCIKSVHLLDRLVEKA